MLARLIRGNNKTFMFKLTVGERDGEKRETEAE